MKSYYINLEIVGLFVLSLIPWPGPTVFKISCPRDSARIVRKLIDNKWTPVLDKYKVSIPLECPFHRSRDVFGPQQSAKYQYGSTQWQCGICGKSFFEEKYLDTHFDNRHRDHINVAEDAVCLADFCDMMRCDVLATQDPRTVFPETINTDVEIWREASSMTKSLMTTGARDVTTTVNANKHGIVYTNLAPKSPLTSPTPSANKRSKEKCVKSDAPSTTNHRDNAGDSNNGNDDGKPSQNKSFNTCQSDLIDSALPAPNNKQQRLAELQKLKANCKPEELQKLKTRCELLVRDCIASLLVQLSVKDFKEVEDELNRAVCWYLTCDRYWEDSQSDIRQFPWGLLCMIVMVLSLGICMCYYIVWVLFDTDDVSVTSVTDRSTPSPAHALRQESGADASAHLYTEDYYCSATDKENEYIYVTYPPDLKRRLLESCYNRTTRL